MLNKPKFENFEDLSPDKLEQREEKSISNAYTAVTSSTADLNDRKVALLDHLGELEQRHNNVFGRWTMSRDSKAIVAKFERSQMTGVEILMDQRNQEFGILAKASTLYTKRFVEKIVQISGINLESVVGSHFRTIQVKFFKRLEELNQEFLNMIDLKEKGMEHMSESSRINEQLQIDILRNHYYRDYEFLLGQFSNTIRTVV